MSKPSVFKGNFAFWLSAAGLIVIGLVCFVGTMFVADPLQQDLALRLLPPLSEGHPLGTDALGRDLLARLVDGGRLSLTIAFVGVAGSLVLGTVAGLAASSSSTGLGWAVERLIDVQMALPYVILAMVLVSAVGPSIPILIVLMILAGWAPAARLVRSVAVSERAKEYVRAAELVGASDRRVIFKYIRPAVTPVVIAIAPLQASALIVMESTLSFLGMGVQPPTPSWGGILLEGKQYLSTAWWLTTVPGIAIALTCAALIGLGSGVDRMMHDRRKVRVVDDQSDDPVPAVPAADAGSEAAVVQGRM